MSEISAVYQVSPPVSLTVLRGRACTLRFDDPRYVPPTPEEVAALIDLAGFSQNKVAQIVGVKFDKRKGSSAVRRWKSNSEKEASRSISYSAWRLLLLHAGVISPEEELAISTS